jgi:hypothetical protein
MSKTLARFVKGSHSEIRVWIQKYHPLKMLSKSRTEEKVLIFIFPAGETIVN